MYLLDSASVGCPYCGESIEIDIDCSVSEQQYVEDCQVCCRPIVLSVSVDSDGDFSVTARQENE